MKDELGERIMKEFLVLRPKIYSCLTEDAKKTNGPNNCVIK